jgi:hypothetical protein
MKKYKKYIHAFLFGILVTFVSCSDEKGIIIVEPVERINALYMTGVAVEWKSTALTKDAEIANVFTYETNMKWYGDDKQFKFTREEGEWNKIRYLVPTEVDHNGNVKIIEAGVEYDMFLCSEMNKNLLDHFWGIKEGADGKYRITVNASKQKLKIERIGDIE